jgi:hypothetical protein
MRIRSRSLDKLVGVAGAWLVRGWLGTVRYKVRCPIPELDPAHPAHSGQYIYAFWHESLLAMVGVRKARRMSVLISRHQDGEYITQIARRIGFDVVRGSSTRGGRSALLGMLDRARHHHLLITPDGPRGPRRQLHPGTLFLASHTGLPIVPVGVGFSHAWRARSWDRFALPKPYSTVTVVVGWPIALPSKMDDNALDSWRCRVEAAMLDCTAAAESWAACAASSSSAGRKAA